MAGSKILGGGVRAHVYRYGGCACSCVQIWGVCVLMCTDMAYSICMHADGWATQHGQ